MCIDILYCSLCIIFVASCFQEGMIFGNFAAKTEAYWPELVKPIFMCIVCMSPWYATVYYLSVGVDINFLVFVGSVGGLNALISLVYGYFAS